MEIVDYAMPMMKIETLMREIHDLCLEHKYWEASTLVNDVEFQSALLRKNLHQMQQKELGQ